MTMYYRGNLIEYEKDKWVYANDKISIKTEERLCPACGKLATKEGHDYCIANLPGVVNACCGHGVQEGYVFFENGIIIRGYFQVYKHDE